jgi:hypothetical protein
MGRSEWRVPFVCAWQNGCSGKSRVARTSDGTVCGLSVDTIPHEIDGRGAGLADQRRIAGKDENANGDADGNAERRVDEQVHRRRKGEAVEVQPEAARE